MITTNYSCRNCEILGIDFGEDDPGSDYPPPAGATITPAHLSDFDPWASRPAPTRGEQ